ncbi:hypothetical protein QFC20_001177 [Naganishia adeliensis]|uniref:Uncharacterized protein n=1 Tax=Naganishia adeliensis TaxID=92952 RepID=A0ACC2WVY1_9TREE|nr:hypothetical protein QFC20_001177 [Naganishia adeliensis]
MSQQPEQYNRLFDKAYERGLGIRMTVDPGLRHNPPKPPLKSDPIEGKYLDETPEVWDGVRRQEGREAIANLREELKRADDLVRRGQAGEWGKEDLSQTSDLFWIGDHPMRHASPTPIAATGHGSTTTLSDDGPKDKRNKDSKGRQEHDSILGDDRDAEGEGV